MRSGLGDPKKTPIIRAVLCVWYTRWCHLVMCRLSSSNIIRASIFSGVLPKCALQLLVATGKAHGIGGSTFMKREYYKTLPLNIKSGRSDTSRAPFVYFSLLSYTNLITQCDPGELKRKWVLGNLIQGSSEGVVDKFYKNARSTNILAKGPGIFLEFDLKICQGGRLMTKSVKFTIRITRSDKNGYFGDIIIIAAYNKMLS